MQTRSYFVYITTNFARTVFYIGVTSDLQRRVYEHRQELVDGFTKRYHVTDLIFFEETSDVHSALVREKQLKGWTRKKKIALIKSMNMKMETVCL